MKALVAMSGGVDSAVAAYLTKKMGYDCMGCTMQLHHAFQEEDNSCGSSVDIEDAKKVTEILQIPHITLNYADIFENEVIKPFVNTYLEGKTPNPCVMCNYKLKFSKLLQYAEENQCDKIVTGHYARVEEENGKFILKKALDPTKDQSYVLYKLKQNELSKVLFPLGNMTKSDARDLAESLGFSNARKKDSQDICFVPDGKYTEFIEKFTNTEIAKGNYLDLQGNVLGKHKGLIYYTIGQHKKLGLNFPEPMYVCKINPVDNTVTLGKEEDLYDTIAYVEDCNWISGIVPTEPIRCKAKIRYRKPEDDVTIVPMENNRVKLIFDQPQRAITNGQSAVFYDGDIVLGGGIIQNII